MTVIPDPRENRPEPAPRRTDVATTVLDVIGAVLVVAFAWLVWWPLALLVAGVACLAMSWNIARGGRR